MENITVYSHNDCLIKDNGENHPERKERLESILNSIKDINSIKLEKVLIDLMNDKEKRNMYQKKAWDNFKLSSESSSKNLDK